MFSRKKAVENMEPLPRGVAAKKGHVVVAGQEAPVKGIQGKVKRAGGVGQNKRAAFGDITNATKEKNGIQLDGKKKAVSKVPIKAAVVPVKPATKVLVKPAKTAGVTLKTNKAAGVAVKSTKANVPVKKTTKNEQVDDLSHSRMDMSVDESITSSQESVEPEIVDIDLDEDLNEEQAARDTESSKFQGDLVAIDVENYHDVNNVGIYAQDIFDYYKRRERMFPIPDYLGSGTRHINGGMRSILVDWMVEVQENFELNHETLYLAVKLTDFYFSIVNVTKENLQLVGAVSIFIASKFDERFPPLIEDFTFVCDNAFDRQEFLEMEMELLRRVGFDIGIPISYRFLRRYAKVARMSMQVLTLARYILELSLMEAAFISERDSMIAAASLFIAMKMYGEGEWDGDVVRSSGYTLQCLKPLILKLNKMMHMTPISELSTIRSKYSHKVFHQVAKVPVLSTSELLS